MTWTLDLDFGIGLWTWTWTWIVTIFHYINFIKDFFMTENGL